MKAFGVIAFFTLASNQGFSLQVPFENPVDSLKYIIENSKDDSLIIEAYLDWTFLLEDANPELELSINRKIIKICRRQLSSIPCRNRTYFTHKVAKAFNISGIIYYSFGLTSSALLSYERALIAAKSIDDKTTMGTVYINIGNIHTNAGNPAVSAGYYQEAYAIALEQKDTESMTYANMNLGVSYAHRGELALADGDHRSYELYNDTCLFLIRNATEMARSSGVVEIVPFGLSFQANLYRNLEKPDSALLLDLQSLKLAEEIQYQPVIAESHASLEQSYLQLKRYTEAIAHGLMGMEIAEKISDPGTVSNCAEGLFLSYDALGKVNEALHFYEIYISTTDTLERESNRQAVLQHQYRTDYEKNAVLDSLSFAEDQRFQNAVIQKQAILLDEEQTQNSILYGFLGIAGIMGFVVWMNYWRKRRDHLVITHQKKEVELSRQEILESINYAKAIQNKLLPEKKEITSHLPGFDVMYLPRDVISGDFYWFANHNGNTFLALADCTGHGVPGAFMSVIGSTLLKDIVIRTGIENPADILHRLDKDIRQLLGQNRDDSADDGMEIALVKINHRANQLTFSGASQHLYIVRDDVEIIKGEMRAIGGWVRKPENLPKFTNKEIFLSSVKAFYLSSDGLEDQFGGGQGEKFGRQKFVSTVLDGCGKIDSIERAFKLWKGNFPQVDDVCTICVNLV